MRQYWKYSILKIKKTNEIKSEFYPSFIALKLAEIGEVDISLLFHIEG